MLTQISIPMVRRWVEKFILKNEFRPSAGLCAQHFDLDRGDAQAMLNEIFATWNAIRHQENQCRRKIYFRAQSRAELAALAMMKKHADRSLKFKAYHCPWCDGWHVGKETVK